MKSYKKNRIMEKFEQYIKFAIINNICYNKKRVKKKESEFLFLEINYYFIQKNHLKSFYS